ncbi:uncharacterized protein [Embiotoca jacksoni]|uniref:uncharacterized protein isoform X2 n=1 Tax=Embiotoca jacksoni TaxID=100190 RepID=UPI003703FE72
MDNSKIIAFRKPSSTLLAAALALIIYVIESMLKNEAELVYLWGGLNLLICIALLLDIFCRVKVFYIKLILIITGPMLLILMIIFFVNLKEKEIQDIKKFEERYLALRPLTDAKGNVQNQFTDRNGQIPTSINHWQTEFKCCGLESYQDWQAPIPDSCLCAGEDEKSGCVEVRGSLVYEKPCLPIVLLLVEKRSSTFWIVMTVWLTIVCVPFAFAGLCVMAIVIFGMFHCVFYCWEDSCSELVRICKRRVPVVFIRKNNNNQTEEENMEDEEEKESVGDDRVVLDMEDATNVEGEGRDAAEEDRDDNPVKLICLSALRRLQKELDPPPVYHLVNKEKCCCLKRYDNKTIDFYTVLIEEGSPLLPKNAILVDPNKPTKRCFWEEGHYLYDFSDIVWPKHKLLKKNHPS